MNIPSLVTSLASRGIQLWAEGDQLRFRGPKGALTDAERAAIAEHRAAVLAHVRDRAAAAAESAAPAARKGTIRRLRPGEPKPMSFAQERLWFFDQIHPGSFAYNLPILVRITGRIDYAMLEQAITSVLARHEVLRAAFHSREGQPVQSIRPVTKLTIPVRDVDGPAAYRERKAVEQATLDFARSFDLAEDLPLRVTLYRIDHEHHVFAVVIHHIVADGWSLGIFARELAEVYRAHATGGTPELPQLEIQYADFAAWQRASAENVAADALAYWLKRLEHAPSSIDLPLDRRRPPIQSMTGAACSRQLDPSLADRVRALSREQGATSFMTLLAAFCVVLARQTGQRDLCVGAPVAGRDLPETEQLIGLFMDTVVLRTRFEAGATFADLIAAVRETTLGAFAHPGVPFDMLVDRLLPTRDLSRTPLFQVLFNALPVRTRGLSLAGTESELISIEDTTGRSARFDLTLYINETSGTLLTAVYSTALFDRDRIQDLLDQVVQVLDAATATPRAPVERFSLVTARAASVLPDPSAPLPAVRLHPVHERFRSHAASDPARIAAADARTSVTYGALESSTNQLANHLIERGIQRGDRVAIYAARTAELPWAMLGVLKAGAAFVIIDPAYPPDRTIAALRIAGPRGWIDITGAPVPDAIARHLLDEIRPVARVSPAAPAGDPESAWRHADTSAPAISVTADDLAYVVFTSGSTGVPKGIAGTHAPLSHFFEWHRTTSALSADDRVSVLSGLAHDPLLRDVLAPLWAGASANFPDAAQFMDAGYLARWMTETGITVAHLTPALADLVTVDASRSDAVVLPTLRRGFLGGDVLTTTTADMLRKAAPQATWTNFYGTSETPQAMAWNPLPPVGDDRLPSRIPLGRGIDGVQLLIVNDAGGLAGIGELGEIHVRTPYLALGYIGDDERTAERFVVNPFTGDPGDRMYRTGDLGRFRPDGSVEFVGRRDAQVKVRGFRIEIGEVEAAVRAHPGVSEAAVTVFGAQPNDEQLVAYLVPAGTAAKAPSDMRMFLRSRLPEHMIPARYVVLASLPLTPNGKLDRAALPEPGERETTERTSLRTAVEREVAAIWSEVLGGREIGGDDSFFDLGGHSLLATRVSARVRSRLGADLPVRAIFEAPTLAEFARIVEESRSARPEREDVVI